MTAHEGPTVGEAQRRIVDVLKRQSPSAVSEIAAALEVTTAAIRQQIGTLEALGLIEEQRRAGSGRGRPARSWSLTTSALNLFPDRHRDLTLELLDAAHAAFGESGVDELLAARDAQTLTDLQMLLPESADLRTRVQMLAEHRSAQGYMAEVQIDDDSVALVQHHCPVCAAASRCSAICRGELELFRSLLGDEAVIERSEHLLSGGMRCVYRISADAGSNRP